MALVSISSSKVNELMKIYDREKEVYDNAFIRHKEDNRQKKMKDEKMSFQNKSLNTALLLMILWVLVVMVLTVIKVGNDVDYIHFLLGGVIAFFPIYYIMSTSDKVNQESNERTNFETGFFSEISKKEYDLLSKIHYRFKMSSQELSGQPMLNGCYKVKFIDISLLRDSVKEMAYINDSEEKIEDTNKIENKSI